MVPMLSGLSLHLTGMQRADGTLVPVLTRRVAAARFTPQ
jgi:hypothetical protein